MQTAPSRYILGNSPSSFSKDEPMPSALSTGTGLSIEARQRRLERCSSVSSTANSGLFGGNLMQRSNSAGSKRLLEDNNIDDITPTKRSKELGQPGAESDPNPSSSGRNGDTCTKSRFALRVHGSEAGTGESGGSCSGYSQLCCREDTLGYSTAGESQPEWRPSVDGTGAQKQHVCVVSPVQGDVEDESEDPQDRENDLIDTLRAELESELDQRASHAYLDRHSQDTQPLFITPSMRQLTISWLVEVADECRMHQETLFLAITLLDRFLSQSTAVPRNLLQLAGTACMFIASKVEEEVHPSVKDYTVLADGAFQHPDLVRMESLVLHQLDFRVTTPTSYIFLSLYRQGIPLSNTAAALASYYTELALLEYSLLEFPASLIAASAILLAQYSSDTEEMYPDVRRIRHLSGCSTSALQRCMEALHQLHWKGFSAPDNNSQESLDQLEANPNLTDDVKKELMLFIPINVKYAPWQIFNFAPLQYPPRWELE